MATEIPIRWAVPGERAALEALQRRASLVWPSDRQDLLAHPDAIELPVAAIDERRTRVAVDAHGGARGFSVVLALADGVVELDGLFVEPDDWHHGVGRALVEDLTRRAAAGSATRVEVIANDNSLGFYDKLGFVTVGAATTRFKPATRMSLRV